MLAAVGLLAACSSEDEPERGLDAIDTPAFEPDAASPASMPEAADGEATTSTPGTGAPGEGQTTTTAATAVRAQPAPERQAVAFDDPVGDAVGGLDDVPPPWSDLAGGGLERQGNAYRLTVRLGGPAPEVQPGSETMNVASFFDVDGDGGVDHELWVNLGTDGWGPVWYEGDRAYPGEDSNVTVVVEGDELRLLFPDVMLGGPDSLRFSLASEYGGLDVIGSDFARRDDAPDGDQAVSFP